MIWKYTFLLLMSCVLSACGSLMPGVSRPALGEADLFGAWRCELKAQRDYIHTFAPKHIVFEKNDDLPAHRWMAYVENQKDAGQEEVAMGYREFFSGWWSVKPNHDFPDVLKVAMTIQASGVERLHQIDQIKQKINRELDENYMKGINERSKKRNFKSLDFFIKPLSDGRVQMGDMESVMWCSRQPEKSAVK